MTAAASSPAFAEGGGSRTVRVFISSTFRDFAEERDLLVRRVFPELRRRAREREVEVVDVDLRWGITEDEAERGETLSICLQEIDRCRPFFIGLLGERYGWQPEAGRYPEVLLERLPWLREHQGGTSVTELEILHGVLKDPGMSGLAFFYLRDPAWSAARGADFASESEDAKARLARLKARIRESGFPVVEDYASPQAVAERILEDLWSRIDARFPASEVSDEHEQERRRHEAFAQTRRSLYVGGESAVSGLLAHLDGASDGASDGARDETGEKRSAAATESARDDDSAAVTEAASVAARSTAPGKAGRGRGKSALNSRIAVVTGESGCGKSALLANAMAQLRASRPQDLVFEHYLGSASDAGNADAIARRLCREVIRRERVARGEDPNKAGEGAGDESGMAGGGRGLGRAGLGEMGGGLGSGLGGDGDSGDSRSPRDADGLAVDSDTLFEELPEYLARGAALARQQGGRFVVMLDALDKLSSHPDASWLPRRVPPGVRLVLSTLEGPALSTARDRDWPLQESRRLTPESARQLVVESLARFNKRLDGSMLDAIASHALATLPIFLRVLTDELRVFGSHEELPDRLSGYLACGSVESLHEQVLARVEGDLEREGGRVEDLAEVLTALWASRRGLSEGEAVELAGVTRVTWSRVSLALDESLFEQSGRWTFSHDYLRKAVASRYLPTESQQRENHAALARWWNAKLREGLGKAIVDGVTGDAAGDAADTTDESADDAPVREPADDALVARAIDELPWQWQQAQSWDDLASCLLDPISGPEIVMRVSDQQIFRWWQALGDHRGLKPEVEYERVWEGWQARSWRTTEWVAEQLCSKFTYTGHASTFQRRLSQEVVANSERRAERRKTSENLHSLCVSLLQAGDIDSVGGNLDAAQMTYERALAIERGLIGQIPMWLSLWCLSTILSRLGRIYGEQWKIVAAADAYEEAVSISRHLLKLSDSPRTQRHLSSMLNGAADAYLTLRDMPAAYAVNEESLAICRCLAERYETTSSLRDLAAGLVTQGDIHASSGNHDAARAAFMESLDIRREIAARKETPDVLRELSRLLIRIGTIDHSYRYYDAALRAYEEAASIRRRLAIRVISLQSSWDLGVILDQLGDINSKLGRNEVALGLHAEALAICRDVIRSESALQRRHQLAVMLLKRAQARPVGNAWACWLWHIVEAWQVAIGMAWETCRTQGWNRIVSVCIVSIGISALVWQYQRRVFWALVIGGVGGVAVVLWCVLRASGVSW